jgi:signal transduction histidine kinase
MQGIENELDLYDVERETARLRIITLSAISGLLILLVVALIYIMLSRRRHMKELRQAYERVLESDNMKSAFIRNVSHEVRTPLNIIGGFTQVLSKEDDTMTTEERKNIASAMQRNTNLITTLIDELLELSFSEATTSVRQTDRVAPVKLLRMAISEFGNAASEATTLKLDTKVPDGFTMLTNEQMMRRIIYTLTDNAVKNTSQGSVTLRLAVEGSQLTLVVEDTGCGIPAGEEERIFDRFVKLDEFKEGLGLGLTLCRSMVSRLGGTVVLDTSYAGPGARFVVNLPVNQRTGTTKAMRKRI